MAQTVENSNVLTILDERAPTGFYWRLTLLATLGGFLFGYDTSNIGSALNFVPYDLRGLAQGYLFLPETKELPVEEIVRVFQQQQEHSALSRLG